MNHETDNPVHFVASLFTDITTHVLDAAIKVPDSRLCQKVSWAVAGQLCRTIKGVYFKRELKKLRVLRVACQVEDCYYISMNPIYKTVKEIPPVTARKTRNCMACCAQLFSGLSEQIRHAVMPVWFFTCFTDYTPRASSKPQIRLKCKKTKIKSLKIAKMQVVMYPACALHIAMYWL